MGVIMPDDQPATKVAVIDVFPPLKELAVTVYGP
jgi:hypothetical protein